ncbi:MAG: hypothetical protein V4671_15230, partial [Armatimonadota bacterium]
MKEMVPLDPELALIKRRYYTSLLPVRSAEIQEVMDIAARHLRSQRPDGTWQDLDYDSKDPMYWGPSDHILRLHRITKAYALSRYKNTALRDGALRSLSWWLAFDPQCPNWWWNQIGVPEYLGEILLLLEKDVTSEQK